MKFLGSSTQEDPSRKWTLFSIAIVAILGVSILAVLTTVVVVTAAQMGGLARMEQTRKASDMARFMARTAFVPVSLEDVRTLKRAVDVYLDDPDLVSVVVTDARNKTLVSRQAREPPGKRRRVEAVRPILPPAEAGGKAAKPVGQVKITLSLSRIDRIVNRSLLWIAAASALLLLLAVAADLTLITRMTRRLQNLVGEARLAEELQRSNRELEQFAFVASHDLQEPLRKIVSFCQLLQNRYKGKLGADADDIIGIIIGGGKRMGDLIRDLLYFARVGTQGKPPVPTDCGAVLQEVLSNLEAAIRETGATVTSGPLPVVMADPGQLSQLFQNLIGNAIKFRDKGPPEVRVDAERHGGSWRLSVRDNGIGIDPKYHDRVFEMFKRLHSKEEYPGTGIGLSICKKIVERHGGRIWIESAVGKGTTFYFTLPPGGA